MLVRNCLRLVVILALSATALLIQLLARVSVAASPAAPLAIQPDAPNVTMIYTVTAQGDTIQTAGCSTGTANCTLRGALTLANSAGASSHIQFDPNMNGKTITLVNSLVVTGGNITVAGRGSEFTFVNAPTNRPAFQLASSANAIDGLAIVGDGAAGGGLQDGVQVYSGTLNYMSNLSLYNLGGQGIKLQGAGANYVYNNVIGTYKQGGAIVTSCLLPNQQWGIVLNSASNSVSYNTIGCNLIDGVLIANNGSNYNLLYGNHIGVTPPSTTIANTAGVVIVNGASHNQIGEQGLDPNVIAGNTQNGIYIGDAATSDNQISNNYIGAVPMIPNSIIYLGNAINGIWINHGAHDTLIGGNLVTASNQIGGNGASGILVLNSPDNQILRNNLAVNHAFGVLLDGITTTGTLISATLITSSGYPANAGGSGIRERNGAANNVWTQVRSYDNRGVSIDKDPTMNGPDGPFPSITLAIRSGGTITVAGMASPSNILVSTRVELYRVIINPNGTADGYVYLATAVTNNMGNWTLTLPIVVGDCFIAFQTRFLLALNSSNSSEFGATNCRTLLPIISK